MLVLEAEVAADPQVGAAAAADGAAAHGVDEWRRVWREVWQAAVAAADAAAAQASGAPRL